MPIRVYNTLTQAKEPLQTVVPGKVGMYVCGPTVYSNSHIGHMVGPVIFDTIKRFLVHSGYDVTWVVNITDVDDKLIVQANAEGTTVKDLAERVTADYLACLDALGVTGIDHMPRATEHIDGILGITQGLIDKGYAYPAGGDVYFDVSKAAEYGKLSHRNPEELQAGARIEPTEKKKHPGDFALWKASKPGEPAWESPWGPGRPGWHIECSAMSMKLLGEHFDIHGGGLDLVFPHHENEVVQSECFSGKTFATYWMHNGLLTNKGRKISKSDPDTVVLMADLLDQYEPDTIRALLLSSHYRRPIDFSPARLQEVERGLRAFRSLFDRVERLTGRSFYDLDAPSSREDGDRHASGTLPPDVLDHRSRFLDAMDDDFNTGGAVGELFELVRALNRFADAERLDDRKGEDPSPALESWTNGVIVLRELSRLLGLFLRPPAHVEPDSGGLTGPLVELFIELRAQARKDRNFALADQIRDRLAALGVVLEDRRDGTGWKIEGDR
ncbi:cysteine--tRNA ligase [Tautonia sp. JC769]|uniref:cysteine--tRNA ligase n=1 Tax=Tautonia sp. JC769 TaxID=3232135 RepID=UPI003458D6FD